MAFSRHNIEKRRLIEMVRSNPILWDCRLPHYKRSDKKKAIMWNELGLRFNVNGERVQRTFTSLREIFRRELNHEKMLGSRFRSKWEYYNDMAFLKEVIRERKSRERIKQHELPNINNNSECIDEYQYFAPSDPNNPNNQPLQQQQQQQQQTPPSKQQAQDNMQKSTQQPTKSPTPLGTRNIQQLTAQAQHLQALQLKPDVTLTLQKLQTQQTAVSAASTANATIPPATTTTTIAATTVTTAAAAPLALTTIPTTAAAATTTTTTSASNLSNLETSTASAPAVTQVLSSSRSCSSSPSIYIKDEPDSLDETISLETTTPNDQGDTQDMPKLKTLLSSNSNQLSKSNSSKSKTLQSTNRLLTSRNNLLMNSSERAVADNGNDAGAHDDDDDDDVEDDDDDDIDDDFDDIGGPVDVDMLDGSSMAGSLTAGMRHTQPQPPPPLLSAREILYTKFGEFLAARLNTLHETVANDLMNKILMLIAEK